MQDAANLVTLIRQWMEGFSIRSMHDWMHFVKTTELSMPQFSVLMYLFYSGGCGVSDVGERMEITNAAASQLIDRLVQGGMLERTEDPVDRRAKQIALTGKGRALIEKGIAERYRWLEDLVSGLTREERMTVRKALPLLIEAEKKLNTSEQFRGHFSSGRKAGRTAQRQGS